MASEVFLPPADPRDWPEWRKELRTLREKALASYDAREYLDPKFAWASRCYSCAMLMTWDERFLDPESGRFRVSEILLEGRRRFGGYDAVVLWHAYPRIGFDDRNQFDFYRDLPGGLSGVREVVRRFQAEGTKVFVDYNPWDTGTRREDRKDAEALAEVVSRIAADGVFLDTMNQGGVDLRKAMPDVAFESELALPVEGIPNHHLSWAQWFPEGDVPGVLRNRWLEQRHMMHLVRRWDTDHSGELRTAWMNGAGMLVWENVFGSWNGWRNEDRETLRAMLPIQRAFNSFFTHGRWTPLVPCNASGLYASEWAVGERRLWTLVNTGSRSVKGGPEVSMDPGDRVFDLVAGKTVGRLEAAIPPGGIGCLYACPHGEIDETLRSLLVTQSERRKSPDEEKPKIRAIVPPKAAGAGEGMVAVEATKTALTTRYRRRECGESGYAPLADQPYPPLHQAVEETRQIDLAPYAIDVREVTNAEYDRYLAATGQKTRGLPPNSPAVNLDLDEARAYARWAGKRLPTDLEWQVAAARGLLQRADKPVWEWTESEQTDGRTRFCMLKGGSWYKAEGSDWYADGGVREPDFAAKFIRICLSLDRCETIGFRCAATLEK